MLLNLPELSVTKSTGFYRIEICGTRVYGYGIYAMSCVLNLESTGTLLALVQATVDLLLIS